MQFTNLSNQIEQTMVSVDRIFEVLDVEPEKEDPEAIELPTIQGHVQFDHVEFEYQPGEPVIKDFSLDVPAGTTVALVGHTGCGKTTLTSLLLRFYEVKSGRILIDGVDISKVRLPTLRRQIGQVLQESTLFHDSTVRENIGYGMPRPTTEQVAQAAQTAEIHEFIESKPKAYEEMIGGRGIKLSVGEKQRMCIARAVVTDPRILILDEATSALDTQSELLIQKALEEVLKGRTSFVIAHRLSTILNADRIVVMDKGEIVEMGTHKELVQKENGLYRGLYEQQFAKARDRAQWETVVA
jgi:ABC-type multidrug transport system fused ATPase/permease subunit